jgi:hypothetical protein
VCLINHPDRDILGLTGLHSSGALFESSMAAPAAASSVSPAFSVEVHCNGAKRQVSVPPHWRVTELHSFLVNEFQVSSQAKMIGIPKQAGAEPDPRLMSLHVKSGKPLKLQLIGASVASQRAFERREAEIEKESPWTRAGIPQHAYEKGEQLTINAALTHHRRLRNSLEYRLNSYRTRSNVHPHSRVLTALVNSDTNAFAAVYKPEMQQFIANEAWQLVYMTGEIKLAMCLRKAGVPIPQEHFARFALKENFGPGDEVFEAIRTGGSLRHTGIYLAAEFGHVDLLRYFLGHPDDDIQIAMQRIIEPLIAVSILNLQRQVTAYLLSQHPDCRLRFAATTWVRLASCAAATGDAATFFDLMPMIPKVPFKPPQSVPAEAESRVNELDTDDPLAIQPQKVRDDNLFERAILPSIWKHHRRCFELLVSTLRPHIDINWENGRLIRECAQHLFVEGLQFLHESCGARLDLVSSTPSASGSANLARHRRLVPEPSGVFDAVLQLHGPGLDGESAQSSDRGHSREELLIYLFDRGVRPPERWIEAMRKWKPGTAAALERKRRRWAPPNELEQENEFGAGHAAAPIAALAPAAAAAAGAGGNASASSSSAVAAATPSASDFLLRSSDYIRVFCRLQLARYQTEWREQEADALLTFLRGLKPKRGPDANGAGVDSWIAAMKPYSTAAAALATASPAIAASSSSTAVSAIPLLPLPNDLISLVVSYTCGTSGQHISRVAAQNSDWFGPAWKDRWDAGVRTVVESVRSEARQFLLREKAALSGFARSFRNEEEDAVIERDYVQRGLEDAWREQRIIQQLLQQHQTDGITAHQAHHEIAAMHAAADGDQQMDEADNNQDEQQEDGLEDEQEEQEEAELDLDEEQEDI